MSQFIPDRRHVTLGALALLAAPSVLRADPVADLAARAEGLDQLHALVIRRAGAPVLEIAPRGRGLDRVANVKSVSKTLLSLMVGIAFERGILPGPDAALLPLLSRGPMGDGRDDITLGHLLSMRAGLASTSGGNYGEWIGRADWVDAALARPLVSEPGGQFIYSTGGWHLLGAALSRQADDDLLGLARDWLGAPLGVDFAPWDRDPQGRYLGGNQMAVTPRGLARIGEMVLAEGRWDGRSVVPASWLDTAWDRRARSRWSGDGYGYGWFLTRLDGRFAAYGRGYGGQVLAVVPDLDTVIAITSDSTRPARSGGYFGTLRDLMTEAVRTVATKVEG
jgi:CubicO group peptidase (beta-lactamase class C family)